MPRFIVTFEVEGGTQFPLDMLRYDCCWPASSDDVANIHGSLMREFRVPATPPEPPKHRKVKLITVGSNKTDAARRVTAGRWASFGWTARVLDCVRTG